MLSASEARKLGESKRLKKLEEDLKIREELENSFLKMLDNTIRTATLEGRTSVTVFQPGNLHHSITERIRLLGYCVYGPNLSSRKGTVMTITW